jgi:hypothetical protein
MNCTTVTSKPVNLSTPVIVQPPKIISSVVQSTAISSSKLCNLEDPTKIYTGVSITFETFKKSGVLYLAVHSHGGVRIAFDGIKRPHLIECAAGIIDSGYNALNTAIKESEEEHGLKICNPSELTFLEKSKRLNYFLRKVKQEDYSWDRILNGQTPGEVYQNSEFIPSIFGKENCIQVGGTKSAIYLVPIDILLDKKTKPMVFPSFFNSLIKYKEFF